MEDGSWLSLSSGRGYHLSTNKPSTAIKMMMFVSSSLPFIRVDLLAIFLNGLRNDSQIAGFDSATEL
jgi:hypothetical protein